jgi:hypothetical protein
LLLLLLLLPFGGLAFMSTPPPPLPFQLALLNALLKSGPSGKQAVIDWLCDALACNASADATQPDERKVSSKAFLGNLCTVRGGRLSSSFFVFVLVFVFAPPLLLLFQYFFLSFVLPCSHPHPFTPTTSTPPLSPFHPFHYHQKALFGLATPFLGKQNLEAKISSSTAWLHPHCPGQRGAFPEGLTPLGGATAVSFAPFAAGGGGGGFGPGAAEPNFITQCFFLGWRALHLGPVPAIERIGQEESHVRGELARSIFSH